MIENLTRFSEKVCSLHFTPGPQSELCVLQWMLRTTSSFCNSDFANWKTAFRAIAIRRKQPELPKILAGTPRPVQKVGILASPRDNPGDGILLNHDQANLSRHEVEGNMADQMIHLVLRFIAVWSLSKFVLSVKECKKIDQCSCSTDEGEISLKKLAGTGGKAR